MAQQVRSLGGAVMSTQCLTHRVALITEVWLGTHTGSNLHVQEGMHGERASGRIKMDLLEERRKVSPPLQPFVPKGAPYCLKPLLL